MQTWLQSKVLWQIDNCLGRNPRRTIHSFYRWLRQNWKFRNGENAPRTIGGTTTFPRLGLRRLSAMNRSNNPLIPCPYLCRLKVCWAVIPRDRKMFLLDMQCHTKHEPFQLIDLPFLVPTAATQVDRWICISDIFRHDSRWCRRSRLQSEPIHWPSWKGFSFAF